MLVKSVIAGTVLSLMAGGVVYFGTEIDAATVKNTVTEKTAELKAELSDKVMPGGEEHPHGDKHTDKDKADKKSANISSVKTPSGKTIEAKKPVVSYGSGADKKSVKSAEVTSPEKPEKKWLNQYLKSEKAKASPDVKAENTAAKDLMDSMGLTKDSGSDSDTGTFIIEETSETGTTRKMLKDLIKKKTNGGSIDASANAMSETDEVVTQTASAEMDNGKTMKIITKTMTSTPTSDDAKGKKMRIKVISGDGSLEEVLGNMDVNDIENIEVFKTKNVSSIGELMIKAKPKDISGTVKVVMEQAEKIEMPELRDRAYLDLVSYGLDHGDYEVAGEALTKIEQVELRDTARNRMAVAYAQDGNAEDAFGILDDLEVDALRDVMRLQVIEAMIAPDELPKDMQ